MKVTFCAYDYPNKVGGPLAWLIRLLPDLQKRGLHAKVLFMTPDPSDTPTADVIRRAGVEVVVTKFPKFTEQRVAWFLEQLIDDPPDVFIPNLAVPAYYAAAWVREAGVSTVGVLHSDDPFHRGLQDEFVFGAEFFRVSGLVCVSKYLENEVLQKGPVNVAVRKIPYGAPIPEEKVSPPGKILRLAYVGRLVEEQKSISAVALALCRAVKEIPGVEATIFGEGPARTAVEQILRNHGQGLPVHLAGMVPSGEIQEHLLRHHALVLLSDYEGLPISLMEAMACGLVPICKDISSGIPELIRNGVNGLLVNDRGDEFVEAVRHLKNDPQFWQELSTNARDKIITEYSAEVGADGWYKFLCDLGKRGKGKSVLQLPEKLVLPPVHPGLAREDFREVAWPLYFAKRSLKRLKKILDKSI